MKIVLAALDASPAARPVLEAARAIADLTGAEVSAVHVVDGSAATPKALATRAEIPFRLLKDSVESTLLDALADSDVIAAVIGARATRSGRRPTGRHTRAILEQANKPVVVVPPETVGVSMRPIRRLLVPLDGTWLTSRLVADVLCPLLVQEVEFLVLHVFTEGTMPRMLDRPGRDLEIWAREFVARYCPPTADLQMRVGSVAGQVAAACRDQPVDLIVLSWAQDSSAGHAAVVQQVFAEAIVPVIVLPASRPVSVPSSAVLQYSQKE